MNRGLIGALSLSVAFALLGGCGSPSSSLVSPSGVPESGFRTLHGRGSSSSGDLIYATVQEGVVYTFTYPDGQFVDTFHIPTDNVKGLCTDKSGNVNIVSWLDVGWIFEYAHGATSPRRTLKDYGKTPYACAVDPTTGNLAVLSYGRSVEVGIYADAQGSPTYYSVPTENGLPGYCAYDDAGNLYVGATANNHWALFELPAGGDSFFRISIPAKTKLGTLQWVSPYLVASDRGQRLNQLAISGSSAEIAGHTNLKGSGSVHVWIQDAATVIAPYGKQSREIGLWQYPQGGQPSEIIGRVDRKFKKLNGVVVSVSPSY